MFTRHIKPFSETRTKDETTMPIALTAFRDKYVWLERNNMVLDMNLEGIMDVFCNPLYYIKNVGFTIESAQKLLKAMGCLLP